MAQIGGRNYYIFPYSSSFVGLCQPLKPNYCVYKPVFGITRLKIRSLNMAKQQKGTKPILLENLSHHFAKRKYVF